MTIKAFADKVALWCIRTIAIAAVVAVLVFLFWLDKVRFVL